MAQSCHESPRTPRVKLGEAVAFCVRETYGLYDTKRSPVSKKKGETVTVVSPLVL